MRATVSLLLSTVLVLVPSRQAVASSYLDIEALNSNLTFGLVRPYHFFYDITVRVGPYGPGGYQQQWFGSDDSNGEAFSGPLVTQTLFSDNGLVEWSRYEYVGGDFEMNLQLTRRGHAPVSGRFVAPITGLIVGAPNSTGDGNDGLDPVSYGLGPGRLDASLAHAFGVRRKTLPGSIDSYMLLVPDDRGVGGDYTTDEREAWDGGTYIYVGTTPVPEPATALLVALGAVVVARRRKTTAAR